MLARRGGILAAINPSFWTSRGFVPWPLDYRVRPPGRRARHAVDARDALLDAVAAQPADVEPPAEHAAPADAAAVGRARLAAAVVAAHVQLVRAAGVVVAVEHAPSADVAAAERGLAAALACDRDALAAVEFQSAACGRDASEDVGLP